MTKKQLEARIDEMQQNLTALRAQCEAAAPVVNAAKALYSWKWLVQPSPEKVSDGSEMTPQKWDMLCQQFSALKKAVASLPDSQDRIG